MRKQNGELTKEDAEFINTKVVGNKSIHLPKDIRYVTYANRDRDAITTVLFEEHCARLRCHSVSTRDTLIILANKLTAKTSHGNYESFHAFAREWVAQSVKRLPGDTHKVMPWDWALNHDIHSGVEHHVTLTKELLEVDPNSFSMTTWKIGAMLAKAS